MGLFINCTEDKYENAILRGVFDAVHAQGANLVCFTSGALRSYHGFEAKRNVLFELVDKAMLDGLVIAGTLGHNISQQEMAELCYSYRPLPMVGIAICIEGVPCLMSNGLDGMQKVIDHLIEQHTCQRIGFIRGPVGQREADERYQAYLNSLAAHALPFDPSLVARGDYTHHSGGLAMRALLNQAGDKPDAVVAANDSMILGALEVLEHAGLSLPVAGFDDTDEGRYGKIPLTTVRQSAYEQGFQAGRIVLSMPTGESIPSLTLAPASLVVRQSCGCQVDIDRDADDEKELLSNKTVPKNERRRCILSAVQTAFSLLTSSHAAGWASELCDALETDLDSPSAGTFLAAWSKVLCQVTIAGDEFIWQRIIISLQKALQPCLRDARQALAFDHLWTQARLLVNETSARQHAERRIMAERRSTILRELGETMVTTYDMNSLLDVIAQNLTELGIQSCYLSLYDEPQKPAWRSHMILGFDADGRIKLPPGGKRFASTRLAWGDQFSRLRTGCMVVEALYSKQSQLGFVVLELPSEQTPICDTLRGLLSSALQGILLLQQREQVEAELRKHQNTLEEMVAERTQDLIESNAQLQREINERQQAEATIRMYADIVNTMQVGLYIVEADDLNNDHSLRVMAANPAALQYSEKTAEQIIGRKFDEAFHTLRRKGFPQKYLTVIKTGESVYLEDLYEGEDGTLREAYSVKVFKLTERSVGVLFENILEQKIAEERQRLFNAQLEYRVHERTAQLEQANKELEAFSYTVSHDLRAPLRAVVGYSSILKNDFSDDLPEQGKKFLQRIIDGANQMGELIDDLLSFSRTSRAEMRRQEVDVNQLVEEVWAEMVNAHPTQLVEFACGKLPACNADRALLKQVWVNLLSNALKYSRQRAPAQIEVGFQMQKDEVIYFVRDNGAGFDMQYAGKLFGVFQRLHRPEDFEGTGIGLATVQRILTRHGGRVWAEAAPNRGATFSFTVGKP